MNSIPQDGPMYVDFSSGPHPESKSIAQMLDEICANSGWRSRWIQRGMICTPHEIKDLLIHADPDVLGCGGWDMNGSLHWVGFDLDVGHGRDDQKYATREDAIKAAMLIREYVGGAAEIRTSKSGDGIHVRISIRGVETNGRKKAALIAKWIARQINVKTDTAVLGRQNLFFWARETKPGGFELVEACPDGATWTPPPEALEEFKAATSQSAPFGTAPLGSDAISQCRRYLAKVPPAIQGQDRSGRCFHAACVAVIDFALSPEDALTALADWNQTCSPPWSRKELEHKIADAAKKPGTRGRRLQKRVQLSDFHNVVVLGVTGENRAALFSVDRQTVHEVDLAKVKLVDFVLIAGPQACEMIDVKKVTLDGKRMKGIRFQDLINEIALAARECSLDELKKLGNGVWVLGDGLIIVGDNIIRLQSQKEPEIVTVPVIDGHLIRRDSGIGVLNTARVVERLKNWNAQKSRAAFHSIYKLINQWKFKKRADALLVCSLVAATMLQTVWEWRLLLWITGQTDAGKTLLLQMLLKMFGKCAVSFDSKVSEAGLRQKLGSSAPSVILDEFEKNTQRERILELLRSSGRGGSMAKGTPGHKPVEFYIRHMVWVGSIDVCLPRAADQNRWIVIELGKLNRMIPAPDTPNLEELGTDLLVSMLFWAGTARELEPKLRHVQLPIDGRLRDNLVVPAAAVAALLQLPVSAAERLLRFWANEHVVKADNMDRASDEEDLLTAILTSRITLSKSELPGRSVREEMNIGEAIDKSDWHFELQRFGIRADDLKEVFIAGPTVERQLLQETKWAGINVNSTLSRFPGARREKQRVAGAAQWGGWLPRGVFSR